MANELKPCPFCGGKAHYTKEIASAGLAAVVTCSDNDCCTNHAETLQKAIDLWNTRPAAPVEGLETVKQELGSVKFFDDFPHLFKTWQTFVLSRPRINMSRRPRPSLRRKSERNDSCKAWRDAFDSMHRRAMDAEADNAALTARVKELEADVSAYILSAEDKDKRRKTLETKLAAARKALERADDALQLEATASGHTYVKIALGEVRS